MTDKSNTLYKISNTLKDLDIWRQRMVTIVKHLEREEVQGTITERVLVDRLDDLNSNRPSDYMFRDLIKELSESVDVQLIDDDETKSNWTQTIHPDDGF